ncbi:MAG: diaminopimelate epimerase [Clostridiales bacterium]|jgi:diaminopimelate epimerase|nr:diaminopimelate epimerase [Clostridiales bacterium]
MKFTKMHGIGNDYVYINDTKNLISNASELAKSISDRHFGIGSDGLILIKASDKADFFMDMYNSDGSRGKMCGNGIRCVGKYVYDYGLTDKKRLKIETLSGIKTLELTIENDKVSLVTVDMGSPIFDAKEIPLISDKDIYINEPIIVGDIEYKITCLSMGNPHGVVFVENTDEFPVKEIGSLFENHPLFPDRVNTEFVEVISRNHIKMRVWERGSGETLACGTGACAAAVASILNGYTDNELKVSLLGGDLFIKYDKDVANQVYMTGPAVTVFEGISSA